MKLSLLFCAALVLSPFVHAATDPGERYLGAYFLIQEADEAEKAGDWTNAEAKFGGALKVLAEIKAEDPSWQTNLIEFRTRYCNERMADIRTKMPAPPAAPAPAVELPAAPSETEQVRQLQAELAKTRAEVKTLEDARADLIAKFEAKLKEPAPTDRASAEQMLEQLRVMRAANEVATAQLTEAKAKADRADTLEAELQQSREKITSLETERTGLNAKLQEALRQVAPTATTPQVEELLKKNADLTAQLASAQADVTKMRDEIAAGNTAEAAKLAESAETVKLRADLGQLQTELEQTKALLAQRTEELSTTRADLEKVRAENIRLTQTQEELMARINDGERQLRAAKASTDKDNEIIQQLRKENALLREVTGKQAAVPKAPPPKPSGGFLWFKPKPQPAKAGASPESSVSRSETGKLTAAVKAPTPPASSREPAPEPVPVTSAGSPLVQSLLADARAAIAQRDYETAVSKFQSVLTQDPATLRRCQISA
jgi:DNA repair exonuclease SbcCD ATPase subunit